jgi:hypothetical protein
MALSQKILDNRRRQHSLVVAHKRKLRDEVLPRLRGVKKAWYYSSNENNRKIRERWHAQKALVSGKQREQTLKHKAKILAHRRRIRAEMANRR